MDNQQAIIIGAGIGGLTAAITLKQIGFHWSRGCVTLLGDAAHPMTPNLGQGGCQAIEDAVILAGLLKNSPDIPSALQTYEARRSRS